jgi:hypothetical protein
MNTKQAALVSIDAMLRQIAEQSVKSAEAKSEPGGYQGSTTHPVKNVDDRLMEATEGERSRENSSDVQEQQGAPSVDSTSESTPSQDTVQYNIGTTQSATGEDPSSETESAKAKKDDPGSSHPMRTDNDSLDGHKYAQHIIKLTEKAAAQGNDLLALLAIEAQGEIQQKAAQLSGAKAPAAPEAVAKAAEAGAELANMAAGGVGADKQAEAAAVVDSIALTISDAFAMAEKTAAYLDEYFRALKKAEDEEGESSEEEEKETPSGGEEAGSDPSSGGSGGEASEAAPAGGSPSEDELLAALMSGGDGMGAEGAASGMAGGGGMDAAAGGAPPMGGMDAAGGPPADLGAGGAPGGMPGGMPGGEPGGMPGGEGGGGEAEQLAMLEAALQQMGITPEQLQAAAVGKQAALLTQRKQAASNATWKPKTAQELQRYRATVDYVRELVGR